MAYWATNSSRRTLKEVTLWQWWGTTPTPTIRLSDPDWLDVLGDAWLVCGAAIHSHERRIHDVQQYWILRPRQSVDGPLLPPFNFRPWLRKLPDANYPDPVSDAAAYPKGPR